MHIEHQCGRTLPIDLLDLHNIQGITHFRHCNCHEQPHCEVRMCIVTYLSMCARLVRQCLSINACIRHGLKFGQ